MVNGMLVGIDLDNICVNTTESVISYLNARLPVNLKMSDITSYSIEKALPKQYQWIVETAFRDSAMWKDIKMIEGAAEMIEKIYDDGHDIWFVTSSLPENLRKKINHLSRNMPFLGRDYIWRHTINIQEKRLLDLDILIDDCLAHAAAENRHYYSILLDYPWNQTTKPIAGLTRAKDWNEIYDRVKMIESLIKENDDDNV